MLARVIWYSLLNITISPSGAKSVITTLSGSSNNTYYTINEVAPGFVHIEGVYISATSYGKTLGNIFAYNCKGSTYDNSDNKVLQGYSGWSGSPISLIEEDRAERLGSVGKGENFYQGLS